MEIPVEVSEPSFMVRKRYNELEGEEIDFFLEAIKTDDHVGGIDQVLNLIGSGQFQLWTWGSDDCMSILITEVTVQRDGERELVIRMLAGHNIFDKFMHGLSDISGEARLLGCSRVTAFVKPHVLQAFYAHAEDHGDELDFEEQYIVISKEIA